MTRRFIVGAGSVVGDAVTLTGGEAHHAAVVLRAAPGDRVVVLDGSGIERVVELTRVTPGEVRGRVVETRPGTRRSVELVLLQGVPKGAKMDAIVRMGTELGVTAFVPVLAERAVAEGRGRAVRWRRIAAEAAKQSGRADVPAVEDPMPLGAALDRLLAPALLLVLWEGEEHRTIGAALRSAAGMRRIALLVGPEGGWADGEVRAATARGGVAVTLGPLLLRTETAGVAALAMVLYELELRG